MTDGRPSFQKILEKEMQKTSPDVTSNSSFTLNTEPAHLAYLLGSTPRHSFYNSTVLTGIKRYPRPLQRMMRPTRPAHCFNVSQKLSFEFLKNFDHNLPESFNARELKSAFRQGAMRVHPDQGGCSQLFVELKTHYENLMALLT